MKIKDLPFYAGKEYERIKSLLTDAGYKKFDEPTLIAYLLNYNTLCECQAAISRTFNGQPPATDPEQMKVYRALLASMGEASRHINSLGSALLLSAKSRTVAKKDGLDFVDLESIK